jgi:hypothetical protein
VPNFIKTPKNLIINFKGVTKTVPAGALYDKVVEMLRLGKPDSEILDTIDPTARIKKDKSGLFDVRDGEVYVRGEALPTSLGNRILDFANSGLAFQPLLKFWDNCGLNPDPRAKTDLYKFLEQNGHPITSDGCFIGYRNVRRLEDGRLVDWNTGNFDNSIGKIVSMRRADCDSNPNETCSRGLHVAAMEYAQGFHTESERELIEVKVNPRDVVAIPTDYNGQKMRVCEFQVVAINTSLITRPLYDPENNVDDEAGDEYDNDDDMLSLDDGDLSELDDESGATVTDAPVDHAASVTAVAMPRQRNASADNHKKQKRDKFGHFIPSGKGARKGKKSKRRNR